MFHVSREVVLVSGLRDSKQQVVVFANVPKPDAAEAR